VRKDGSLVPVRLNGFLVEREGAPYIWSVIEDMTSQRALEARVEEERLKAIQASKLATLGEMAAGVAHEINNPLGIVDLYAFALEKAIASGDMAQASEAIAGIRDATGRAAKIVQGLRKFARQSALEAPEELSVASLVEDALGLCRARICTNGVDLLVDVRTESLVRGHSIELAQVLVNLLNNAFDAARHAEPKWIRLTSTDDDDGVTIVVENAGPPIPPEIASEIFRAFFTTKKMGEGTGLGLSISRSIVERHDGSLTHDALARETRFIVRLPRVKS